MIIPKDNGNRSNGRKTKRVEPIFFVILIVTLCLMHALIKVVWTTPKSNSELRLLSTWSDSYLDNSNNRLAALAEPSYSTVVTTITTTTTIKGITQVTTKTTVQHSNHSSSSLESSSLQQYDVASSPSNKMTTKSFLASKSNKEQHDKPSKQLKLRIPNLQSLSRRNASRALCGYIPKKSPKGVKFPKILLTSKEQQQEQPTCRPNAIVYLAQKGTHASYGRNSSALFTLSVDSLYNNYLSIDNKYDSVDVLIFHSGDFEQSDLDALDNRYQNKVHFKLVNLNDTDYWVMPESVQKDDRHKWQQAGKYTLGYRHMLRWYSLKLYDFARDYATKANGCSYSYLMRMDEDSFLHSPIQYNIFDFMKSNNYAYAFRLCSFEMEMQLWHDYADHVQHCGNKLPAGIPRREMVDGLCGFYNNFFIIDVQFILQPDVQNFLQWTDATGVMYRERYNDLQIQTFAVYAFAPPERIHRFLDWTYEHMSDYKKCPRWGALQAGYLDTNVSASMDRFRAKYKPCESNLGRNTYRDMYEQDLSPTYAHLPPSSWFEEKFGVPRNKFSWKTYAAAAAEWTGRGILSG